MTLEPSRNQPSSPEAAHPPFARTEEAWDIYRLLVENSYDLVAELDANCEFIYVNPSYERSLGFVPESLLHRNFFDFVFPQDVDKARRELKQLDGTTIMRLQHKTGAWKWFDCSFRQFQSPSGFRSVLISRDISARKEAEIKFDILASLGSKLSSAKSQIDAGRVIAEAAKVLCAWDAFSLDLYNAEENLVVPVLTIDEIEGKSVEVPGLEIRPPSPFVRTVLDNGPQRVLRKGNDFDETLQPFGDTSRPSASLLFVPIVEGGATLGILSIQSYRINAYARSDLKLLQVLAAHCAGTLARIRVTDELRESRARFEAFMENTPAAAWIKDEASRYIYANRGIQSLYRKDRTEIVSHSDQDFLEPKTAARMQAEDAAVRASGETRRAEGSLLPGDPRQWFVCRFPFKSPGGSQFVGGLAFDISGEVQLQRSLNASEERFRTLFEASPVAIGLVQGSTLLFTNGAYRQMFELPAGSVLATRSFLHNIAPAARSELDRYFGNPRFAAGLLAATEVAAIRSDGTEFPCLVQIAPVEIQEGRAHLVFIVDISEKRALEAQLFQSQKMESIGRLAGGIAHDFANLLTVIQGHASRLERGVPNPVPSLDGIIRASHKATELTRQLLAFSRKQTLQIVELDFNTAVAQAARMIERILGENITLRLHLAADLPPIFADQMLIEQLVLNLAVTSRDSMRSGGHLTISTYYLEPETGGVPAAHELGSICLRVEDTGRGFAKEDLPHIFEPFFRTGSGMDIALRLATVYGIVKQHNGDIAVSSDPGTGTAFEIAIPAAAMPPKLGEAGPGKVRAGAILIVEDSNELRCMLRDILADYGFPVLDAPGCAEARRLFEAQPERVALVIADVLLGDGSGRELARELRERKPDLRAVIITGYDPHQMRGKIDLQPNELFLAKPFQTRELLQAIEALLCDAKK